MADADPADTHGHTHADADEQEPELHLSSPAGSEAAPTSGMVLAQTTAEVQAQIDNFPG